MYGVLSEGLLGIPDAGELYECVDVAPFIDDFDVDDFTVGTEDTVEVFLCDLIMTEKISPCRSNYRQRVWQLSCFPPF